jgi:CheY-like chemotaxis protein
MDLQSTILYVATESVDRAVLTDALSKAGFNVREAATGSEALAGVVKVEKSLSFTELTQATDSEGLSSVVKKPDLILIDVNLPDLNGFEVCKRLKANPEVAGIPVLLMSATFTQEVGRLQALAAGADDYLLAPVEPAVLLQTVEALLQTHNSDGS